MRQKRSLSLLRTLLKLAILSLACHSLWRELGERCSLPRGPVLWRVRPAVSPPTVKHIHYKWKLTSWEKYTSASYQANELSVQPPKHIWPFLCFCSVYCQPGHENGSCFLVKRCSDVLDLSLSICPAKEIRKHRIINELYNTTVGCHTELHLENIKRLLNISRL